MRTPKECAESIIKYMNFLGLSDENSDETYLFAKTFLRYEEALEFMYAHPDGLDSRSDCFKHEATQALGKKCFEDCSVCLDEADEFKELYKDAPQD